MNVVRKETTMFVTTKKNTINGKTYEYVQIIENYRVGKKIKQRVIHNLGRKDKVDPEKIDLLIENLEQFSDKLMILRKDNPDMKIKWSRAYGLPLLYQKLWEQVGLDQIIENIASSRNIRFNIKQALFCIVLNRLVEPRSELAIMKWKEKVHLLRGDFDNIELQHLYRTLDVIEEEKETIETKLFEKTRNLFNTEVTLVFFDTTSTYFEGSGKHSHELLQYGKSKDHRADRKQITVGVLLDQHGIPIGCEINSGNTQDATAIKKMIDKVKQRFALKDIIWVADGGMAGEENIKKMHAYKQKFILGARMKNVKELYEKIEDEQAHQKMTAAMQPVPDKKGLLYYEFESEKHENRKYVIVYNAKEAKRERETREQITKKLQEVLKQKNGIKKLIANKKYKSYLKIEGASSITVDEEKLKRDERYDGLFVLQTDTSLPTADVIMRYKDLYQIEQAFRDLKSTLDVRPIYHRKDERITAHVFVAFLALYLRIIAERLLARAGLKDDEIREGFEDVGEIQMAHVTLKDNNYLVRTELPGLAHSILTSLGISSGPRIRTV